MKMESESGILPDKSDNSALKECWNGGKRASQLNIDMEATELLLNLLKEKWSLFIDNKTNKKQIWNDIATGLSEQGFLLRGVDKGATCRIKWENLRKDYKAYIFKFTQSGSSAIDTKKKPKHFEPIEEILGGNNHSYRPPYISDSFNKNRQNPTKFTNTMKEIANQKTKETPKESSVKNKQKETDSQNKKDLNKESTDEDESRTSKVGDENMDRGGKGNEISGKRCSNNAKEDEIQDDDIFLDELDGEDASSLPLKKRRPSRASKSDKVLLAFNKMREERKERYVEENKKKEKRHNEKMEKTQQLIDVLKSMGSMDSSKRTSSRSRSASRSRSKKRSTSPKFHPKKSHSPSSTPSRSTTYPSKKSQSPSSSRSRSPNCYNQRNHSSSRSQSRSPKCYNPRNHSSSRSRSRSPKYSNRNNSRSRSRSPKHYNKHY